ncbi:MAG: hypothetical protein NUV46_00055 [Nanoarchaeota archaeon]|nr:hypothetical protein [Nanoarchaeota archaeon]
MKTLEKKINLDKDSYKEVCREEFIVTLISMKILNDYKDKTLSYMLSKEEALKYFQPLIEEIPEDKEIISGIFNEGLRLREIYSETPNEDYLEVLERCEGEGIDVSKIKEKYKDVFGAYNLKW